MNSLKRLSFTRQSAILLNECVTSQFILNDKDQFDVILLDSQRINLNPGGLHHVVISADHVSVPFRRVFVGLVIAMVELVKPLFLSHATGYIIPESSCRLT